MLRLLFIPIITLFITAVNAQPQILSAPIESTPEQNVLIIPNEDVDTAIYDPSLSLDQLCKAGAKSSQVAEACDTATLEMIHFLTARASILNKGREARQAFDAQTKTHTIVALKSQSWKGYVFFYLSILIIFLGILAASLQFFQSWRSYSEVKPTEITISARQVSIKTAWIGVVLLGMSMGFFIIYLIFVYKIEQI